jgi:hypothetical protein
MSHKETNMFIEYDWTFNVYRPRFGQSFIAFRGERSFPTLADARAALKSAGLKLGRKTDTRTWSVETD